MDIARRQTLDRLVDNLRVPEPWDVALLCDVVGEARRRRITLTARQSVAGDSIYATVFSTGTADHVFVRDDLRGLHRDQAICHELGHLLAGHTDTDGHPEPGPTMLGATALGHLFNRTCDHSSQAEAEAEYIGRRILTRVADTNRRGTDGRERGFGDALR